MTRALWILNHKTLLPAEVPLLRSLGVRVWVPKLVPEGPAFGGTVTPTEFDADLDLPPGLLEVLNGHNFYTEPWTRQIEKVLNLHFDLVVTSVYQTPLTEAVRKFSGTVVARVFGREIPETYTRLFGIYDPTLLADIKALGDRFVFGQGYPHLAGVEDAVLRNRAMTLPLGLPDRIWQAADTWTGNGEKSVLLLSPLSNDNDYYRERHAEMKALFFDTAHKMFGRRHTSVDDPAVLPYLSDDDLIALYQSSPVFAYNSTEPRHVHYSPIEAMAIGTPVLYRAGSLLDLISRDMTPGRCESGEELVNKSRRLLAGDAALERAIRASQRSILEAFSSRAAAYQWRKLLGMPPLNPPWDVAGQHRQRAPGERTEWWPVAPPG